jgi:glucan biosynthesis protein
MASMAAAAAEVSTDRATDGSGDGTSFSHDAVVAQARRLAASPHVPSPEIPQALKALDYDSYRAIRYRKDRAIRFAASERFSVELFAPGFLFGAGVDLFVVADGQAKPLLPDVGSFETPSPEIAEAIAAFGRFAGFRLHYPINEPLTGSDHADEFVVFQGASYFRAVSRGQLYGTSARGLALSVAQRDGEEFPRFRRFWIEPMVGEPGGIIVHALLDSPSVAGAWRFEISPGLTTIMDVSATLFPRRALTHVGMAPLTSMFMHGPMDGPDEPDYRPAVHDSGGILMHTGSDTWVYRPLANPRSLQVSAFRDSAPRGFGLVQRARSFDLFQDLEARYEARPSAWVEPRGDWGPGHVDLVEIPSASETNDNIVAYWRPQAELPAGEPFAFAYRLSWPDRVPVRNRLVQVQRSAMGRTLDRALPQVVIDWDSRHVPASATLSAVATASAGRVLETLLQRNEETGGTRVFVTFDPGRAALVELRVELQVRSAPDGENGENGENSTGVADEKAAADEGPADQHPSEVWLYRWLAE